MTPITLTNTDIFRELLPINSKYSFQSSYQTIMTLSESFFKTVLQNMIFQQRILRCKANHTEIFRELPLNATGHALLKTFRKKKLNQANSNDSRKTKKSEKLGKPGQMKTL